MANDSAGAKQQGALRRARRAAMLRQMAAEPGRPCSCHVEETQHPPFRVKSSN